MAVHFHVLGSGSSGNSSLLEVNGFGVLIDIGFGPRSLAGRLPPAPGFWDRVHAALLTHVHGDHWNENTLKRLRLRGIPLQCHAEHAIDLRYASSAFAALADAGLVRHYEADTPMELGAGCRCTPLPLSHDGGETFGFRFNGPRQERWALGYAADLGCWDKALARGLADVDVLALEFNHDVGLQYQSGRSPDLIRRVLSDRGHLSNVQAADLFAAVLRQSRPGRLRHLVQLHLSRQCNKPELARWVARLAVERSAAPVEIHTACQASAGPSLVLAGREFAEIG